MSPSISATALPLSEGIEVGRAIIHRAPPSRARIAGTVNSVLFYGILGFGVAVPFVGALVALVGR